MNGGETIVCNTDDGCGEPFEIKQSKLGEDINCPYCGAAAGLSGF